MPATAPRPVRGRAVGAGAHHACGARRRCGGPSCSLGPGRRPGMGPAPCAARAFRGRGRHPSRRHGPSIACGIGFS